MNQNPTSWHPAQDLLHQLSLYHTLLVTFIEAFLDLDIEHLIFSAYDKSLRNFFRSDSRAKRYVKDVYALAEPFLEGESNLGTEVHMKLGPIKYVDENVDADGLCAGARGPSRQVRNLMESQRGNLVPMVIIAEDTGECDGTGYTTGCAYV